MAEQIILNDSRKDVDEWYVGFKPNGGSIKPVHVAGGVLRSIYGEYNATMNIKRLALVSSNKGVVPKGNELDAIYAWMMENEMMEESVDKNSLDSLRNVMQRLLSADKGVFVVAGLKDNMISYTAGSSYFITRGAMYEDTGEFMGGLIREYCPKLADYIKDLLASAKDPISLLFEPVLEAKMEVFQDTSPHEKLPAFQNKDSNQHTKWFLDGIKESGLCLLENLKAHPNALTQLRLFNFFCIFHLVRYMAMLETFYCNQPIRPILLDFSKKPPHQSSVARASELSYTQMYKSLNRFYAWGFAEWLKAKGYDKTALLECDVPVYEKRNNTSKASKEELKTLWSLAKNHIQDMVSEEEVLLTFGETIYDMLALQATSHPVKFLRALGTLSGILYPPDTFHPDKRFMLSQDMLEMLLRSCVRTGEILSGREIRERLWKRFGIIVGGSQFELGKISESGMIMQVDEDALETNFASFAATLKAMDFAEEMADGILQIRLGGLNNGR